MKMENLDYNDKASIISMKILNETQRLVQKHNAGEPIDVNEVKSIPLDDLREAFEQYGDNFMSDELLERIIRSIKKTDIKKLYPDGCKLLLGAFPSDANGNVYTEAEIKKGEHLTILFLDPKTGLSSGYGGGVIFNTYAKLLPQEIQDHCTFTPKYSLPYPIPSKNDANEFIEKYLEAYKNLKKLLKG